MKNSILIFLSILTFQLFSQEKITFKASDGLEITASLYITNPETSPLILLFHQAGWSRGEYNEIAPKLNKLGFNCIAIDQRSGGEVNGIINETYKRALLENKGTSYVDALVDLNSAINYARSNYKKAKKLIIWGSSYSAGLVLKIAGDRKDVDAVLAFSPGEYFAKLGRADDWIKKSAKNITIPTFITSAKLEKKKWWEIAEVIPASNKAYFLPTKLGKHGSRALWNKFSDSKEYWKAVEEFLEVIK
jgi:dienelactone hydrolase